MPNFSRRPGRRQSPIWTLLSSWWAVFGTLGGEYRRTLWSWDVSVQNQVDEVIDVMQENITKVIERGERLDDLQDKSESLADNATAFSSRSRHLRRQMWWRECKMKAIVALVFIIILLVIIVPIILKYRN
ncbi:hypothetical protein GDO86_007674 [Hymenochirus boettgeri]|uniref:V-SNARE coiled-coil homology domain-containing protein n=1 Tax=Hymenochirus boettgeri TaxID=247094 RepID=A0A8T2J025_9PIPI|nr:hypothetical protein GDO86_007674 [Hymenochirus boettgeri]